MPDITPEFLATQAVEIAIFDRADLIEPIRYIPRFRALRYLDERNRDGAGSFQVPVHDPIFTDDPDVLAVGRVVRVSIGGTPRGWFEIERVKAVQVADPSASGLDTAEREFVEVSGPGPLAWLRRAVVYPPGIGSKAEIRRFDFTSEDGAWRGPGWHGPVVMWTAYSSWKMENWISHEAKWVWDRDTLGGAPVGDVYFRHEFTTATEKECVLYCGADDMAVFVLDGEIIVNLPENSTSFKQTTAVYLTVPAGDHVLAIQARNTGGPAGVLYSLQEEPGEVGELGTRIVFSHHWGTLCLPYPSDPPGYTPGQMLDTLLSESSARGVDSIDRLTPTFTTSVDTNGLPWTTGTPWAFTVGATYRDVAEEVMRTAADVWVDASLNLNMALVRGTIRNVGLLVGKNVRQVKAETSGWPIVNELLVRSSDALREVESTVSQDAHGRREGYITAAEAHVDKVTAQVFTAQAIPLVLPTVEIVAVPGTVPWVDFEVGDYVRAPANYDHPTGTPGAGTTLRRVASIGFVTDDENSLPRYSVEIDSIRETVAEGQARRLARHDDELLSAQVAGGLAGGYALAGLGGGSGTSNPTPAPPVISPVRTPSAPTALTAVAAVALASDGQAQAEVTLTWSGVSLDTWGDSVSIAEYEVQARRLAPTPTDWAQVLRTDEVTGVAGPFSGGETWQFRVRARSDKGIWSAYSGTADETMPYDSTPPNAPSGPVLTTRLGVIQVEWDGLDAFDDPMPVDFDRVEIAMGAATEPTTIISTLLRGAGTVAVGDQPYGQTRYFRLRAVDTSGNASAWSTEANIATQALVDTDVIGEVIDGANIVDGTITASDKIVGNSITGALIQALAIATGHLQANSVTADKIIAGAVTAGKIALGAVSPGVLAFGVDEYVPNPAWSVAAMRTLYPAAADMAYDDDSGYLVESQTHALRVDPGAARSMPIAPEMAVAPGEKFYLRLYAQRPRDIDHGIALHLNVKDSGGSPVGVVWPWASTNWANNPSCTLDASNYGGEAGPGGAAFGARVASGGVDGGAHYRWEWTSATTAIGGGVHLDSPGTVGLTQGSHVTVSAYVRSSVTQRVALSAQYLSPEGVTMGASDVGDEVVLAPDTWTRVHVSGYVRGGADRLIASVYATPGTSAANWAVGDTLDIDHVLVEEYPDLYPYFDGDTTDSDGERHEWLGAPGASASAFETSHATALRCEERNRQRTNWVTNPSVEVDLSDWAGGSATLARDSAWAAAGIISAKVTPSGGSTDSYASLGGGGTTSFPFDITPGRTYTLSATVRLGAAQAGTVHTWARRVMFHSYDGSAWSNTQGPQAPNAAGATRLSLTFTVPDDAEGAFLRLYNGSNSTGDAVWWDAVLLEEAVVEGDYFDGDSAGASWAGTDHDSRSTIEVPIEGEVDTYRAYETVVTIPPGGLTIEPEIVDDAGATGSWRVAQVSVRRAMAGALGQGVEISPAGFRLWGPNEDVGEPDVELTTNGLRGLVLRDADNVPATTVTALGGVVADTVSAKDSLLYQGVEMSDYVGQRAVRGALARADDNQFRGTLANISTETGICELRFDTHPTETREYAIRLINAQVGIHGRETDIRFRIETDGSAPTTSSTEILKHRVPGDTTYPRQVGAIEKEYQMGPGLSAGVLVSVAPGAIGSGNVEWNRVESVALTVYDEGRSIPRTGADGSGSTPTQSYDRTYGIAWGASYKENNTFYNYRTERLYQGRYPDAYTDGGNTRSLVGFTPDMMSDIAGATISDLWVTVRNLHAYSSVQYLVVGLHPFENQPSTFALADQTIMVVPVSRGGTVTFRIPDAHYSNFTAGGRSGIGFYVNSFAAAYYGYLDKAATRVRARFSK